MQPIYYRLSYKNRVVSPGLWSSCQEFRYHPYYEEKSVDEAKQQAQRHPCQTH